MKFFEAIFMWIGAHFSIEAYMISTKIQGILWSMADIALILALLKIAGVVRMKTQRKKIRFRHLLLWFSAILTPLLILTRTPQQFLILESIICGTQFSILLYTVIVDRKETMELLKKIGAGNEA